MAKSGFKELMDYYLIPIAIVIVSLMVIGAVLFGIGLLFLKLTGGI